MDDESVHRFPWPGLTLKQINANDMSSKACHNLSKPSAMALCWLFIVMIILGACGEQEPRNPFRTNPVSDVSGAPDVKNPSTDGSGAGDENKGEGVVPLSLNSDKVIEEIIAYPRLAVTNEGSMDWLVLPLNQMSGSPSDAGKYANLFSIPSIGRADGTSVNTFRGSLEDWFDQQQNQNPYLMEGFVTSNYIAQGVKLSFTSFSSDQLDEGTWYEGYQGSAFAILGRGEEGNVKSVPYFSLALGVPWTEIWSGYIKEDTIKSGNILNSWFLSSFISSKGDVDENNKDFKSVFIPDEKTQISSPGFDWERHSESLSLSNKTITFKYLSEFPKTDDSTNAAVYQSLISAVSFSILPFDYGLMLKGTYTFYITPVDRDAEVLTTGQILTQTSMTLGYLSPLLATSSSGDSGLYSGRSEASFLRNKSNQSIPGSVFSGASSLQTFDMIGVLDINIKQDMSNLVADSVSLTLFEPLRREFEIRDDKTPGAPKEFIFGGISGENSLKFKGVGESILDRSRKGFPFSIRIEPDNTRFTRMDTLDRWVVVDNSEFEGGTGYLHGAFYGPNRETLAGVWSFKNIKEDADSDQTTVSFINGVFALKNNR